MCVCVCVFDSVCVDALSARSTVPKSLRVFVCTCVCVYARERVCIYINSPIPRREANAHINTL